MTQSYKPRFSRAELFFLDHHKKRLTLEELLEGIQHKGRKGIGLKSIQNVVRELLLEEQNEDEEIPCVGVGVCRHAQQDARPRGRKLFDE